MKKVSEENKECDRKDAAKAFGKMKTKAKASGLKSVFLYDNGKDDNGKGNRLAVISFRDDERGTSAGGRVRYPHAEKVTTSDGKSVFGEEPLMFESVAPRSDAIELTDAGGRTFEVANPSRFSSKSDYIGLKSKLEEEFFGKAYGDDTFRVQIAYNIVDIRKILVPYVSNVIHSVLNISGKVSGFLGNGDSDYIGTMDFRADFQQFMKKADCFFGNGCRCIGKCADCVSYRKTADSKAKDPGKVCEKFYKLYCTLKSESAASGSFRKLGYFFPGTFEYYKPAKGKQVGIKANGVNDANGIPEGTLRRNYDCLRFLSMMRQFALHKNVLVNSGLDYEGRDWESCETLLFKAGAILKESGLRSFVDDKMNMVMTYLNAMPENLSNNIFMLAEYYGDKKSRQEILKEYCTLVIRKENRNLGVNLRKIRELIIDRHLVGLRSKEWDSCRQKAYAVLDFIIYDFIKDNEEMRIRVINDLRGSISEGCKEAVYEKAADLIFSDSSVDFPKALRKLEDQREAGFNGGKVSKSKKDDENCQEESKKKELLPEECRISPDDVSGFAKVVYLLGLFLENKDINILFDSLISKFDSIADLVDCVRFSDGLGALEFGGKYFGCDMDFRRLSSDMRLAKSLGKLCPNKDDYEAELFKDALLMLGIPQDEINGENWQEYDGRIFEAKKGNKNIRNFIINNVLKSRWFYYLSKTFRPADCHKLIKNESVVRFAVESLPDSQIDRYNGLTGGNDGIGINEKKDSIVNTLIEFSFKSMMDNIESLTDKEKKDQSIGSKAERNKKIVTLYLTVLYLIVKGISAVNVRFQIAFSCLERDKFFLEPKESDRKDYLSLVRKFLDEDGRIAEEYRIERKGIRDGNSSEEEKKALYSRADSKLKSMHYSLKYFDIIKGNLAEAENLDRIVKDSSKEPIGKNLDRAYVKFRNQVMHFDVLSKLPDIASEEAFQRMKFKSYYSVYRHILIKSLWKSVLCNSDFCKERFADFSQSDSIQRNLMWVLNIPFAYNLARYKNLSIEDIFNDKE